MSECRDQGTDQRLNQKPRPILHDSPPHGQLTLTDATLQSLDMTWAGFCARRFGRRRPLTRHVWQTHNPGSTGLHAHSLNELPLRRPGSTSGRDAETCKPKWVSRHHHCDFGLVRRPLRCSLSRYTRQRPMASRTKQFIKQPPTAEVA